METTIEKLNALFGKQGISAHTVAQYLDKRDNWDCVTSNIQFTSKDGKQSHVAQYSQGVGLYVKKPNGKPHFKVKIWDHDPLAKTPISKWSAKACFSYLKYEPNPAEVFADVCRGYLDASPCAFEAWALDFGYDTDSRKAEEIYNSCLAGKWVLRFVDLRTAKDFAELISEL